MRQTGHIRMTKGSRSIFKSEGWSKALHVRDKHQAMGIGRRWQEDLAPWILKFDIFLKNLRNFSRKMFLS